MAHDPDGEGEGGAWMAFCNDVFADAHRAIAEKADTAVADIAEDLADSGEHTATMEAFLRSVADRLRRAKGDALTTPGNGPPSSPTKSPTNARGKN